MSDWIFENYGILFAVLAALMAIVQAGFSFAKTKVIKFRRAIECVEAGVFNTYETYVKALKDAAADGKLTDDERKVARDLAINAAKTYAKNQGIELAKYIAEDYLPVLIDKFVQSRKTNPFFAASPAPELD